jgi:hypothetical protein
MLLGVFQELFKPRIWNGIDSRDAVLTALSYVPITDFSSKPSRGLVVERKLTLMQTSSE